MLHVNQNQLINLNVRWVKCLNTGNLVVLRMSKKPEQKKPEQKKPEQKKPEQKAVRVG